jgi:hypothetical protein
MRPHIPKRAQPRFLERNIVMSVRVKNGTPLYGPSLCETCSYGCVTRGYRESEEVVVCQATSPERRIRFRVRDCSRYLDRTKDTLYDMRKIALSISPKGNNRHAGFLRPGEAGQDVDVDEFEFVWNENE